MPEVSHSTTVSFNLLNVFHFLNLDMVKLLDFEPNLSTLSFPNNRNIFMDAVYLFYYFGYSFLVIVLLVSCAVLIGVSIYPAQFLKFLLPIFKHPGRGVIIFKYLCRALMKINKPVAEFISSAILMKRCELLSAILLMNSSDSDVCINCCSLIEALVKHYDTDNEIFLVNLHKANIVHRLLNALQKFTEEDPAPNGSILKVLKVLDFFAHQQFDKSVSDEFTELSMSVLLIFYKEMDSESLDVSASVFDIIRKRLSHLVKLHSDTSENSASSDTAEADLTRDAEGSQSPARRQEIIDHPAPHASSVVGTIAVGEHRNDSQSVKKLLVRVLEHLLHHKLGNHLANHFKIVMEKEELKLQPGRVQIQLQLGVSLLLEALQAAEVLAKGGQMVDDTHFAQQISSPQLLKVLNSLPKCEEPLQGSPEWSDNLKKVLKLLEPVNRKQPLKKSSSSRSANSVSSLSSTSSAHPIIKVSEIQASSSVRWGSAKLDEPRTVGQSKKHSFLMASFQSSTLQFFRGKKNKAMRATPEEKSNLT